jgi:hypothetical protein
MHVRDDWGFVRTAPIGLLGRLCIYVCGGHPAFDSLCASCLSAFAPSIRKVESASGATKPSNALNIVPLLCALIFGVSKRGRRCREDAVPTQTATRLARVHSQPRTIARRGSEMRRTAPQPCVPECQHRPRRPYTGHPNPARQSVAASRAYAVAATRWHFYPAVYEFVRAGWGCAGEWDEWETRCTCGFGFGFGEKRWSSGVVRGKCGRGSGGWEGCVATM